MSGAPLNAARAQSGEFGARVKGPLEGIVVADFCWVGAGSYTTKILADHGADVIKVESSAKVDGLRLSPPYADGRSGVNRSGYFADRNSSKRSLALNMKLPKARELARKLVERADVVANNFTPGTMDRFGLGWDDVQAFNPSIVYLAMSMQGSTGPHRDHLGYGLTMGALVGLHHLIGEPDGEPVGTGTNYPDHVPNPGHAAFAVLAALRHRRRTGEGQYIDLAQIEPTVAVLGPTFLEWSFNGVDVGRRGNRHRWYAPHGIFRAADDQWLALAVVDDPQWVNLCEVLGLSGGSGQDSAWRRANVEVIEEQVTSAVARVSADELERMLRGLGIPAVRVRDASDVLSDPQLGHREHWQRLPHAEMGDSLYGAPPLRLSRTPGGLNRPAPLLGEHTVEICKEVFGLGTNEIEALSEEGVLA